MELLHSGAEPTPPPPRPMAATRGSEDGIDAESAPKDMPDHPMYPISGETDVVFGTRRPLGGYLDAW